MDSWHYEPAADLDQPLLERLRNFPREPDMLVYGARTVAAMMMRAWLRMYHRLKIVGRENLPIDGSFVMVANHTSHLDTLCLLSAIPYERLHRTFPAAAQDYFFVSVPRLLVATVVVNALPFHRQAATRQSLGVCGHLLANPGNVLLIFPEGTRSPNGVLQDFRPGVGLLLAGSAIPVVPCHVAGAHRAWPKGCWLPRPCAIRLTIGRPRCYADAPLGKVSALAIARELHDDVERLGARN
ncbi:MAG: lysophospholipid acyltransferase family protein [Planctomycetota bacterium]